MEKYEITMSKSEDFSKSKPHLMFWNDEDYSFRNIHDPDQGFQFLDENGEIDTLGWMIDKNDGRGCIRSCRFIGHPGGFCGATKIILIKD